MKIPIPLQLRLKKKAHRAVSLAQDMLVTELYNYFPLAVLHGGTAIWRCYQGNRFSEDVDVYLPLKYKNERKIKDFLAVLKRKGFSIKKFNVTKNNVFSKMIYQRAEIQLEILFKDVKDRVLKEFELLDGTFMTVYTLSPEKLLLEKILAYNARRKIRDLYDIFFLLRFVKEKKAISKELTAFLASFKKPVDEPLLKSLILFGLVPKLSELLIYLEKWVK